MHALSSRAAFALARAGGLGYHTRVSAAKNNKLTVFLVILIVVLYALDQASKWYIVLNFPYDWATDLCLRIDRVIADSGIMNFNIVRVHNTGVAFGTGNGTAWAPFLFLGVQVVALVWLFHLYRKGFFSTTVLKFAWALITVGVLGNMTDRLVQGFFRPGAETLGFFQNLVNGYVVDFLDFSFPWLDHYHWPSFNVADSCVCVAAALFLISCFTMPREDKEKEKGQA